MDNRRVGGAVEVGGEGGYLGEEKYLGWVGGEYLRERVSRRGVSRVAVGLES